MIGFSRQIFIEEQVGTFVREDEYCARGKSHGLTLVYAPDDRLMHINKLRDDSLATYFRTGDRRIEFDDVSDQSGSSQCTQNTHSDKGERFCMSVFACNTSQEVNGVSWLHGKVSQEMFSTIWKGYFPEEMQIAMLVCLNICGCSDFLEEDPKGKLTTDNFYNRSIHC